MRSIVRSKSEGKCAFMLEQYISAFMLEQHVNKRSDTKQENFIILYVKRETARGSNINT